jgi:hypothetical protein
MALDNNIFMFIGDKAFTLKELGPIADMGLSKAFQAIMDNGLLGEEYVGLRWHDVIRSSGISLDTGPAADDEFLTPLYEKYKAELDICKELSERDELTEEAKEKMLKYRRDYMAAKKLTLP